MNNNKPWSNAEGCLLGLSEDLSYEKMEEDLTCLVCLELYADPLMMPCSHSVCKACLHDIMKSREKSGKQDLECPACRETHHLSTEQVNLLPKNLALENIVFRYQEIRSYSLSRAAQLASPPLTSQMPLGSPHSPAPSPSNDDGGREQDSVFEDSVEERLSCGLCEESERNEAQWFCPQCQVLYCQVCLDTFHPRRGSLFKHKVRRPTVTEDPGSLLFCHDHLGEMASIFCDTCKVVACHLCVCLGQGAHCAHTILDLETAKRQLQETVETAQEKLAALVASFSEREINIETHLNNVKAMEDSARSSITSQYNCIMSDIKDTLDLAKKKSLDAITEISSIQSSYLLNRSRHIKALLSRCEDLSQACRSFLTNHEDSDDCGSVNQSANSSFSSSGKYSREETTQANRSQKTQKSMPSRHLSEGSTLLTGAKNKSSKHLRDGNVFSSRQLGNGNMYPADGNTLSNGHSRDGSNLSEGHRRDFGTPLTTDETKSTLAVAISPEDGSTVPRTSPSSICSSKNTKNKIETCRADSIDGSLSVRGSDILPEKSFFDLSISSNSRQSSRSLFKSQQQTLSVEQENQCTSSDNPTTFSDKQFSVDGTPQSMELSFPKDSSPACGSMTNSKPLVSIAKNIASANERKLSGLQSLDETYLTAGQGADYSQTQSRHIASGWSGKAVRNTPRQGQEGKKPETGSELLLRADEVGPVLEQVSALSKQVYLEQSKSEEKMEAINKDHNQNINACISDFHSSTLHLINNMTAEIPDDCRVITPCVRSVSVASPQQESSVPRVHSRVLMTWGFNSTTFTADPITTCVQWSININRNTSHIGDVKSGYLFGVGVALRPLTSKEQVGMGADSHAIVCINGSLAFCHDKQISPIMSLSEFPLSVTISVNQSAEHSICMTYKIRVNGLTRCLQGRRIISMYTGNGMCQEDENRKVTNGVVSSNISSEGCGDSVGSDSCKSKVLSSNAGDNRGCNRMHRSNSDDDGDNTKHVKSSKAQDRLLSLSSLHHVHPVFTVSQRVKMQFPHTSEV